MSHQIVDICIHCPIMFFEQLPVVVLQVALPGYGNACAAPEDSAEPAAYRRYVGKPPIFPLCVAHGHHMTAQKLWQVTHVGGCTGEDRDISAPSHAFVTLRTIGGDGDEVSPARPHNVLPQPVDFWVGTPVVRSRFMDRTEYPSLYGFKR